MAEQTSVAADEEISDGAGRIVAGRFHTVTEAEIVLARLRDLSLVPQLQERSELPAGEAHLWIWVLAEDLEQARTCMRPGDVTGAPRSEVVPVVEELEPQRKGFLSRFRL